MEMTVYVKIGLIFGVISLHGNSPRQEIAVSGRPNEPFGATFLPSTMVPPPQQRQVIGKTVSCVKENEVKYSSNLSLHSIHGALLRRILQVL